MRIFAFLVAGLVSARSLTKLQTTVKAPKQELCGKGFDSLNPGSQDYFNTISDTLWTHPGNQDGFGVFQSEMKCWFARMVENKCGGLSPNADRKKELYADCTNDKVDHLKLWNHYFSDDEFAWFKQTFPAVEDGDYSEAMKTMKDMNTKEVLCSTLFVIDDGCVAFKYVKKA